MFIREDAKERAKELAVQGLSKTAIRKKLEKEGMAGLLDDHSLESVVREGHTIGHFMPAKPNKVLARVVGVIAVLMGAGAIYLGGSGRWAPGKYGWAALSLGVILIVKPHRANEEADD